MERKESFWKLTILWWTLLHLHELNETQDDYFWNMVDINLSSFGYIQKGL